MNRVAIIGGGISGTATAYYLARQAREGQPSDFVLFESSPRLGGIVETVHRDGFVIECGPDSWVSEKPAARTGYLAGASMATVSASIHGRSPRSCSAT